MSGESFTTCSIDLIFPDLFSRFQGHVDWQINVPIQTMCPSVCTDMRLDSTILLSSSILLIDKNGGQVKQSVEESYQYTTAIKLQRLRML